MRDIGHHITQGLGAAGGRDDGFPELRRWLRLRKRRKCSRQSQGQHGQAQRWKYRFSWNQTINKMLSPASPPVHERYECAGSLKKDVRSHLVGRYPG